MKLRVQKIEPFPFSSDFQTPGPSSQNMVQISVDELAHLLAAAQQNAAEIARDDTLTAQADRLVETSSELKRVLEGIVDLAAYLEKASIDEADRRDALDRVRRLASVVLEQQGDLFKP